jgi:hypothetical protein
MLETAVIWMLLAVGAYLGLGVLFALPFAASWVGRVDPDAAEGSLGFRLLIFPGAVALWPWLVRRLRAGRAGLPVERTPHRTAAAAPAQQPGQRPGQPLGEPPAETGP